MYAIGIVPEDGMIRYDYNNRVHHRESFIPVEVPDFDTLAEAKAQLTGEPEELILEFNEKRVCEVLWIPRKRKDVFINRLKYWHTCYGGYETRFFSDSR